MESNFDTTLADLLSKSTQRLMLAEVFDLKAFQALKNYLVEKSEKIKDEHVVSKQVLQAITFTISIIKSRSEHLPEVKENLSLAKELDQLMYTIIAGESPEDEEYGRI